MDVVDISIVNDYNKFVKAFSYEKVCLFQNLVEMKPMMLFKNLSGYGLAGRSTGGERDQSASTVAPPWDPNSFFKAHNRLP